MKKYIYIAVHILLTLAVMTAATMLLRYVFHIGAGGIIYNGLMILIIVASYEIYKKVKTKFQ